MNDVDFDALSFADVAPYKVKHPDPKVKAPIGTIMVSGPGHPQTLDYEEFERRRELEEIQDYQMEQQEAIDTGMPMPKRPDEKRAVADIRARNAERLAARVVSADFTVSLGGRSVELTKDTAAQVLANPKIGWLYEGMFTFVRNRANFMIGSAG